jgi:protoporphyrinogen oxidase
VLLAAFFLDRASVTEAATLYFADPAYAIARVYEPRNRNERMAPPGKTSLVAEIPCDPGDAAWSLPDGEIVRRARADLVRAGLLQEREILGSCAHRMPYAYPVMEIELLREARKVLDYLGGFVNLKLVGRSACYRYLWMHELIAAAGEVVGSYAAPAVGTG